MLIFHNASHSFKEKNKHLFELIGNDDSLNCEKELHDFIKNFCRQMQWVFFHGSTAHRTHRTLGEPDFIILMNNGKFLMVECKTEKGKLSPEQELMIKRAKELGHTIHVIRSRKEFVNLVKEVL